jgi:hypothetical protein
MKYALTSLTIIFGTCLSIGVTSCASTTFYHEGKPVASFQGDMKETSFTRDASGAIRWKAGSVSHSAPTTAGGNAIAKGITTTGVAVATSGLTKIIK